ncbi:MAG: hypothetical protein V1492_02580 [Candidatus Micrarchaeota archaeon]
MAGGANVLADFPGAGEITGGAAFNVAIYAIVSMLMLVGIVYLIGRVFHNRKLEDWSKSEFLQVFVSAAIVGGLVVMLTPGSGLIVQAFKSLVPSSLFIMIFSGAVVIPYPVSMTDPLCGTMTDTVLCFAFSYLTALEMQIGSLMSVLFLVNFVLDILSKLSIDIIIVQVAPLSGLGSVVQVFNSILQSLLFLGIITGVEMAFLHFINATALTIFLPIGVVLRCFFATRRVGGALMALGIGLYIVFPLTIALNAISIQSMQQSDMAPFVQFVEKVESLNPASTFTAPGDLLSPEKWAGFIGTFASIPSDLINLIGQLPVILFSFVSSLVVQIVFLPVLSIIITVIAIKELAALFGSELNLGRFEV